MSIENDIEFLRKEGRCRDAECEQGAGDGWRRMADDFESLQSRITELEGELAKARGDVDRIHAIVEGDYKQWGHLDDDFCRTYNAVMYNTAAPTEGQEVKG